MSDERNRRRRLGEILVAAEVLTEHQLEDALAHQRAEGRRDRLGSVVVRLGLAIEEDIAEALATQLGYETVDLAEVGPESAALSRVPRKLAERHHALPLLIDEDDVLVVAMSDPTNVVALDDLRLTSNLRAVRPVVATESAVEDALRRVYGSDQAALDLADSFGQADVVSVEEDEDLEDLAKAAQGAGEQPIVRLANAILADAVRTRTSDIHVEPGRENVRVRYRIDGMLREKMRVPKNIGPALISRLKIMSQLDIAERRRPQDGRAMIRVEGQEVDLRVSTMPTMHGETIVLRLLRKGTERLLIDDLGFTADAREIFEAALAKPQGLIICTGPTGSGKTTTLYAGLSELSDPVRNVLTLEDPIEYQLEGVNQTQVNPKIGLTFARGLRTVLRQDPDIVMVGEIRDQETAELAMEASFTGHLVLSTLHTNDAPSSIVRLVDLGVERFLIASSVVLIVAQRLVRVNCHRCVEPTEADPKTLRALQLTPEYLEGATLMAGTGCQVCEQTGFVGRTAVYEMLVVTPQLRDLIVDGAGETQLARHARAHGMRTLREDALAKAYAGETTLEEALRVTPDETITVRQCTACASPLEPEWTQCPYCETPVTREGPAPRVPLAAASSPPPPTAEPPVDATTTAGATAQRFADELALSTKGDGRETGNGQVGEPSDFTVLVVDDDPSIRELLQAMLVEHTVHLAEDGEGALERAAELQPDAIVLDFKLPDLDGIEVTKLLRDDPKTREIAVLMITGVDDPHVEVEGLLAGVDDFLTKPFDEDVLKMRLRGAVLRAARTQA